MFQFAKNDVQIPQSSLLTWDWNEWVFNRDNGQVVKKADPSLYTTVRFITAGAIAPRATVAYTYEVRVK